MAVEAFANNWAYLKVELNNLERLLLAAVAKQKKDQRDGDRLLKTHADRAAQHWLQGLMNVEGPIGYDAPPPQRSATKSLTYNQQLEKRIQATQDSGRVLALPALCDRLELTVYEKNLLLLGIAPEIHRRYAKLYEYLNGNSSYLLTVDLSLRLLCRNDQEWRQARSRLKPDAPLVRYGLIDVLSNNDRPFLQHAIRLSGALVNYLLADQTANGDLDCLLANEEIETHLVPEPATSPTQELSPPLESASVSEPCLWAELPRGLRSFAQSEFAGHLVLPDKLRNGLLQIAQEAKFGQQLDEDWGFASWQGQSFPGQCVLFTGPKDTGKMSAAGAIAQYVAAPLMAIDLREEIDLLLLCQQLKSQSVKVLLVQNADLWLGRQAYVNGRQLQQFFDLRCRSGCVTVFTTSQACLMAQQWRQQMSQTLEFKIPRLKARMQIWRQAFPPQIQLDPAIDWESIAKPQLTGGEIMRIARHVAMQALLANSDELIIKSDHIRRVQ